MAPKIRIEYSGATYHVMARGKQGRNIYADEADRRVWLETLAVARARTGWRVHGWAIRRVNGAAELGLQRLRGRLERASETAASSKV